MSDRTLSWIHLSDLHMRADGELDQRVVLQALWQDIGRALASGFRPDFIAFTGDVAYHAATAEYEIAAEQFFDPLLKLTGLEKGWLFIVPGNHDVFRPTTAHLKAPLPATHSYTELNSVVRNDQYRDVLLTRFSNYRRFAERYWPTDSARENAAWQFTRPVRKGSTIITVAAVNSAWLSGFNHDRKQEVVDYGYLAVSELQLFDALSNATGHTIVLMHHPLSWLMPDDRHACEMLLAERRCVVLRGHVHRPDVLSVSSSGGNCVVIPCGSVFAGRPLPHGYNLVRVDLDTGSGEVQLRRYNSRRNEWQKDLETTGERADGVARFVWPGFQRGEGEGGASAVLALTIRDYRCTVSSECQQDLVTLGIAQDQLLDMVQREFRSHVNYFRYDLEDYPLPLGTEYLLFLNKIGGRLEFRRLMKCSGNEARMASWGDILALYRRATRMAYREAPEKLATDRTLAHRVASLHADIDRRLVKYYDKFDRLKVDPLSQEIRIGRARHGADAAAPCAPRTASDKKAYEIAFHLERSSSATREALDVLASVEDGDVKLDDAIPLMVVAFEGSLQHLHKIILGFPPVDSAGH